MQEFLKEVVFRIDLKQLLSLPDDSVEKIREALKDDFPDIERQTLVTVTWEVGGPASQSEKVTRERQYPVIVVLNKKTNNRIVIEPYAIIFDLTAYTSYSNLVDTVKSVLDVAEPLNPESVASRIGLRYVNQIVISEGDPYDWRGVIADRLLCDFEVPSPKEKLIRQMSVIEFEEDESRVKFQFGMYNSEYPSRIAKKEFALDYDCYSTTEAPLRSTIGRLEKYHGIIKSLYAKSISESQSKH
jgi:uncharacterized protein (TIGR04255 family)